MLLLTSTHIFKVEGSTDIHMVDNRGNHFISTTGINGTFKCVNPTAKSGGDIGDTYPKGDIIDLRIKPIGSVPFEINDKGEFVRL